MKIHLLIFCLTLSSSTVFGQLNESVGDSTFSDGGLDMFSRAYSDVRELGYQEGRDSLLIWKDVPISDEVLDFFDLENPTVLDNSFTVEYYFKCEEVEFYALEFKELMHNGPKWIVKYNVYHITKNMVVLLASFCEESTKISEHFTTSKILWYWRK